MAFTDRIVQHPGRVKMTPVSGQTDVYDMTAQEGTVTTEGTLLNAANLNAQTQLDSAVLEQFQSAGMAGQYQNDMSNALDFLLGIANIEVKSSGNWFKYIELGSLVLGWFMFSGTLTIQTATGSLYTSASPSTITFPSELALSQALFADVRIFTNSYPIETALRTLTASNLTYQPLSTLSRASATYSIEGFVAGLRA